MSDTLCDWKSDGSEVCEDCRKPIPKGGQVHFISDGGFEPRDGTYIGRCCLEQFTVKPTGGQQP